MTKNPCSKTVKVENAYEIWEGGGFTWHVLKKYQSPEKEAQNPYARWFCACKSPFTYGSYEYGDTYVKDVTNYAVRIK